MSSDHFTLIPNGAFSLAASIGFLTGFTPVSYDDDRDERDNVLRLAFCVERDWRPAAVSVRQTNSGSLTVTVTADVDRELVIEQTARMLSLEVDASTLEQIVRDDRVAAEPVSYTHLTLPTICSV